MKITFVFILVLGLSFAVGKWLSSEKNISSIDEISSTSTCDPTKEYCEIEYKKILFILGFKGTPSGLVPFEVSVKSDTIQPESIELSFDMQGMDMGYNVYNLKRNETDWSAKVILPVCSLARNDWLMNVKLVFKGESLLTQFRFTQTE